MSKYIRLFFPFLILFIFLLPQEILADSKEFIVDEAGILTDQEVKKLEEQAGKDGKKRDISFYILTTDGEDGIDIEQYMTSFVDEQAKEKNIILLGIDMKESDVMIMGFDKGKERLDNERASQVREKITPYLSEGEFYQAFELFIKTSEDYLRFRPGVNPDSFLFKTTWQLLFALALGGVITLISVSNVGPKDTTSARIYQNDKQTKILRRKDRFIRRTVSKQYSPRNKNQGGRGGGGGFSSGAGRTSGGRSYSGSRGKF